MICNVFAYMEWLGKDVLKGEKPNRSSGLFMKPIFYIVAARSNNKGNSI